MPTTITKQEPANAMIIASIVPVSSTTFSPLIYSHRLTPLGSTCLVPRQKPHSSAWLIPNAPASAFSGTPQDRKSRQANSWSVSPACGSWLVITVPPTITANSFCFCGRDMVCLGSANETQFLFHFVPTSYGSLSHY